MERGGLRLVRRDDGSGDLADDNRRPIIARVRTADVAVGTWLVEDAGRRQLRVRSVRSFLHRRRSRPCAPRPNCWSRRPACPAGSRFGPGRRLPEPIPPVISMITAPAGAAIEVTTGRPPDLYRSHVEGRETARRALQIPDAVRREGQRRRCSCRSPSALAAVSSIDSLVSSLAAVMTQWVDIDRGDAVLLDDQSEGHRRAGFEGYRTVDDFDTGPATGVGSVERAAARSQREAGAPECVLIHRVPPSAIPDVFTAHTPAAKDRFQRGHGHWPEGFGDGKGFGHGKVRLETESDAVLLPDEHVCGWAGPGPVGSPKIVRLGRAFDPVAALPSTVRFGDCGLAWSRRSSADHGHSGGAANCMRSAPKPVSLASGSVSVGIPGGDTDELSPFSSTRR